MAINPFMQGINCLADVQNITNLTLILVIIPKFFTVIVALMLMKPLLLLYIPRILLLLAPILNFQMHIALILSGSLLMNLMMI